jgi:hypothetical protein
VVTLAVLTGTSAALAGAGVSLELAPDSKQAEPLLVQAVQSLAWSPLDELRTTVAGMLAVVGVQSRLGFISAAPIVEDVLLRTLALVNEEHGLHEYIAPGRPGTREWKAKADVLSLALDWVGPQADVGKGRKEFRKRSRPENEGGWEGQRIGLGRRS